MMKERFLQFMYGRYGLDPFSKFLLIAGLVLLFVSGLFEHGEILYLFSLVLLVYSYFRIFSKNHTKRYAENQAYLKYTAGFRKKWMSLKSNFVQRKDYHIYKCPSCGQKIRIPRGKGKIEIRCPKCSTHFIKKS